MLPLLLLLTFSSLRIIMQINLHFMTILSKLYSNHSTYHQTLSTLSLQLLKEAFCLLLEGISTISSHSNITKTKIQSLITKDLSPISMMGSQMLPKCSFCQIQVSYTFNMRILQRLGQSILIYLPHPLTHQDISMMLIINALHSHKPSFSKAKLHIPLFSLIKMIVQHLKDILLIHR